MSAIPAVRAHAATTLVLCGECGARFATTAPRDFIVRVRRCGECGERGLVIEAGANGAARENGSGSQGKHEAPST